MLHQQHIGQVLVGPWGCEAQNTTNLLGGKRRRLRPMMASTLPCSRMPNSISSCRCRRWAELEARVTSLRQQLANVRE